MDQSTLKKLKRSELLEIIVSQKKRIEELEEQVNVLEHADDQNIHLSVSRIGSWGSTLRLLADVFEGGERSEAIVSAAASAAGNEPSAADAGVVIAEPDATILFQDAAPIKAEPTPKVPAKERPVIKDIEMDWNIRP